MHIIAAKAVSLKEALEPAFTAYAAQVVANAKVLAAKLLEHGFNLVSGGTDNHLLLVDLCSKGLTGKLAEKILGEVGITVNKNTVPFETENHFVTSGIRNGTLPLPRAGMKSGKWKKLRRLFLKYYIIQETRRLRNVQSRGYFSFAAPSRCMMKMKTLFITIP